jgi:hypothetical protein
VLTTPFEKAVVEHEDDHGQNGAVPSILVNQQSGSKTLLIAARILLA